MSCHESRATGFATTLLLVCLGAGPVAAELVTSLNTGIDPVTGALLPEGALDPRYVIGPGGSGGRFGETPFVRVAPLPGGWLGYGASPSSRWLALRGGGFEGVTVSEGTYFFDFVLDLTGFDAASARLTGLRYAADNKLLAVVVNGADAFRQPSGFAEEFQAFRNLGDLGLGLFHEGQNVIRFQVENALGFGDTPMGLRVEGAVEANPNAVVPEPSTLVLLGAGALGLLGYGWRRA